MSYRIEGKDIVISGFEQGIASSPYEGIADMRNIEILSVPGEASVQFANVTATLPPAINAKSVTLTASDDTVHYTASSVALTPYEGMALFFNTVTSTGLAANQVYYVLGLAGSFPNYTFKLKNALGTTSPVNITSDGVGTYTAYQYGNQRTGAAVRGPVSYFVDRSGSFGGDNAVVMVDASNYVWIVLSADQSSGILANHLYFAGNTSGVGASSTINSAVTVWNGYLLLFGATHIDYVKTTDLWNTGPNTSWFYSWQTITTNATNNRIGLIVSEEDGNVYWTSADGIGSIILQPGFTFNPAWLAFTLPPVSPASATIGATYTNNGHTYTVQQTLSNGLVLYTDNTGAVDSTNILTKSAGTGDATIAFLSAEETFTITNDAVQVPGNDEATCLAELGSNILIGGQRSFIYVWDKISLGFTGLLNMPDNFTVAIVPASQNAYVFTGNRGRIFITNGSGVDLYKKIPDYVTGLSGNTGADTPPTPFIEWNDASFSHNQLIFGFSSRNQGNVQENTTAGIWAIDLDTDAFRMLNRTTNTEDAGYTGQTNMVVEQPPQSSASYSLIHGQQIMAGWSDIPNNLYGVDVPSNSVTTTWQSYIETDMIPVGTFLDPFSPSQLEWKTSAPLKAADGVRISYRPSFDVNYTLINTTTGTAGPVSGLFKANFQKVQWAQFLIELTTNGNRSGTSFTRLTEMRVRDWPSGKNSANATNPMTNQPIV